MITLTWHILSFVSHSKKAAYKVGKPLLLFFFLCHGKNGNENENDIFIMQKTLFVRNWLMSEFYSQKYDVFFFNITKHWLGQILISPPLFEPWSDIPDEKHGEWKVICAEQKKSFWVSAGRTLVYKQKTCPLGHGDHTENNRSFSPATK